MPFPGAPPDHARRLLETLGVRWEINADRYRRMKLRDGTGRGRMTAQLVQPGAEERPALSWIDYRASVSNASVRRGREIEVPVCGECGCELDVKPAPHSPRCKTASAPSTPAEAARCAEDGCDELARGLFCEEHGKARAKRWSGAGLNGRKLGEAAAAVSADEAADAAVPAASAAASPSRQAPQTIAASWTRERIIDRIKAWAAQHGGPPASTDWHGPTTEDRPNFQLVARVFRGDGTLGRGWGNAIEAAGFPRPTKGSRSAAKTGPAAPPRESSTTRRPGPAAAPEKGASGGASNNGWITVKAPA